MAATGELFQGYAPRMVEVHRRNAAALTTIINEWDWPGRSLVGPIRRRQIINGARRKY